MIPVESISGLLAAALALYLTGAFVLLRSWQRDGVSAAFASSACIGLGIIVHALGIITRGVMAERIPLQNLHEAVVGAALAAGMVGCLGLCWLRRAEVGLAGSITAAAGLVAALLLPIPGRPIEAEAAILQTAPLLVYHVGAVLMGYALIAIGAVVSLIGLFETSPPTSDRARALDAAQWALQRLAMWILGGGVLLGAWWADHAWGRWWAWDPKEVWALVTWLALLAGVHARVVARRPSRMTALSNLLALALMLWSAFGVNLMISGLHSYAGN